MLRVLALIGTVCSIELQDWIDSGIGLPSQELVRSNASTNVLLHQDEMVSAYDKAVELLESEFRQIKIQLAFLEAPIPIPTLHLPTIPEGENEEASSSTDASRIDNESSSIEYPSEDSKEPFIDRASGYLDLFTAFHEFHSIWHETAVEFYDQLLDYQEQSENGSLRGLAKTLLISDMVRTIGRGVSDSLQPFLDALDTYADEHPQSNLLDHFHRIYELLISRPFALLRQRLRLEARKKKKRSN